MVPRSEQFCNHSGMPVAPDERDLVDENTLNETCIRPIQDHIREHMPKLVGDAPRITEKCMYTVDRFENYSINSFENKFLNYLKLV
jgi:hypothetical protein